MSGQHCENYDVKRETLSFEGNNIHCSPRDHSLSVSYTSLASHSCEKSFVLKHQYEAKDVQSIVIQI